MGVAIDIERPIALRPDAVPPDQLGTGPARGPAPTEIDGEENGGSSLPPPRVLRTAGATVDGERDIVLEDVGGARLLISDVRVALLLLDDARYRAVRRLFGVPRDQSWAVTLIALAVLAQAAHEKSDQMGRGPGGPTRADVALGAAVVRELLAAIPGPQARETPFVATLVTIALVGALARPGPSRAAHEIRSSSHRARQSFNHRYGHLLPMTARGKPQSGGMPT